MNTMRIYRDYLRDKIGVPFSPNPAHIIQMARSEGLSAASKDQTRILRLHVDEQDDFILPFTYRDIDGDIRYVLVDGLDAPGTLPPHMEKRAEWVGIGELDPSLYPEVWGGRLSVSGAVESLIKTLDMDFTLMPHITQHAFSIDSHGLTSVFDLHKYYATRDDVFDGGPIVGSYKVEQFQHPLSFSILNPHGDQGIYHEKENPNGLWRPIGSKKEMEAVWHYAHSLHVIRYDKDPQEVMPLMLWPIHCTRQTAGGAINSVVWANALAHGYGRFVEPILYFKGLSASAEHYGIYRTEVQIANDPHTKPNLPGLSLYQHFDFIAITGQAKSHCVLRTVEQAFEYVFEHDPDQVGKLVVIEDGMNPIPGTEAACEASFAKMEANGLRISTVDEFTEAVLTGNIKHWM